MELQYYSWEELFNQHSKEDIDYVRKWMEEYCKNYYTNIK